MIVRKAPVGASLVAFCYYVLPLHCQLCGSFLPLSSKKENTEPSLERNDILIDRHVSPNRMATFLFTMVICRCKRSEKSLGNWCITI